MKTAIDRLSFNLFVAKNTYFDVWGREIADNNNNDSYDSGHEFVDNKNNSYGSGHELITNNSYSYGSGHEFIDNNSDSYGSPHTDIYIYIYIDIYTDPSPGVQGVNRICI